MPEKEYSFVGKNLTPEEKETSASDLEVWREEAMELIDGEPEKTPEQLKFIETINDWLAMDFQELGLEKQNILPEQIHLLPHDVFTREFPETDSETFFRSTKQATYIDINRRATDGRDNRMAIFQTIFHEGIHLISAMKFQVDTEKKLIKPYRTGYTTHNITEESHEHFRGFDEAIVDKIIIEAANRHEDEFIKKFNIKPEELEFQVPYYTEYMDILETIIERMAEKNNKDESEIWSNFKKGIFSGQMMHLRDIERTFGEGSLRLIAALGSSAKKNLPEKEIEEKILKYFTINDEKEKDNIAKEVLIERERLRYQNRRQ